MKIAGADSKAWGLSLIRSEDLLNLPARKEPFFYDWGDLIEPLTDEQDLFFEPNSFFLEFFYEPPKGALGQSPAGSLYALLEHLGAQGSDEIALETSYKATRAKIVKIKEVQTLGASCGRFSVIFREAPLQVPSFPSDLKRVDKEGLRVNGYPLQENTGLILSECKEAREIPPLRKSALSIYKRSALSVFRENAHLFLKLHGFYESPAQLSYHVERFKAMMGSPGIKNIRYKGFLYGAYLTSGIKVKLLSETLTCCELSLEVSDKIPLEC